MNLAQLRALLAAGTITQTQYDEAAATVTALGVVTARPALTLRIAGERLEIPDEDAEGDGARTLGGVISRYEYLIPSHQMILHTGCLVARQPLDRVKLLRDHNHADPVGYMLDFDPATLDAEFHVAAGENGDRALTEAREKLRDGFSVGFTISAYDFDDDWVLHVWEADFYETSLCAIPAVADAGITNIAAALTAARKETSMNKEQLAAALAAGTITQAQHDARLAALTPPSPEPQELAAGPEAQPQAPARLDISPRGISLNEATSRIAEAVRTHNTSSVVLALQSLLPSDDAGHAFYGRADWIGEVWTATPEGRPWIESFGTPKPLTGGKIEGFRWKDRIAPAKYSGNLAEVPTGKAKTEAVSKTPDRWAFGTRVDRIFTDLGSPDAIASLFELLGAGYQQESDKDVAAQVIAAATVETTGDPAVPVVDTSVLGAIARAATSLRRIGARVDNIWLAEDLFEAWSELKIADLPAWLANALGFVDLREGTSVIGDLRLAADPKLDDGDLVAYDKRAVSVYETNAIQLETIVVANGGLDIGWFNYGGTLVNDARAISKRTVVLN